MSDQTGSWQPDPFGRHQYRYWDGTEWTDQVSNDGIVSSDPAVAAPVETPDATATSGWGAADATTSMPTAEPSSFPPPAFAATAPVAEPPKKGSGNKPAFIVGGVLLLGLLGAGAWLLFGNKDDDGNRADLVASLQEQGISNSQANCMVDELADSIGLGRLGEIDRDSDSATDEENAAILAASFECSAFGSDDDDGDDGDAGGAEIDLDDPLLEMFIQGMMSESELTEAQARCFSEEFLSIDDLDFSELMSDPGSVASSSSFMAAMFGIFDTCDIPLESLGGGSGSSGGIGSGGSGGILPGQAYGDNAELDALWDACDGGDGEACDDLYFSSEFGSEYEEFGDTCGGRFPESPGFCTTQDLD